jgi:hypothetical protein
MIELELEIISIKGILRPKKMNACLGKLRKTCLDYNGSLGISQSQGWTCLSPPVLEGSCSKLRNFTSCDMEETTMKNMEEISSWVEG